MKPKSPDWMTDVTKIQHVNIEDIVESELCLPNGYLEAKWECHHEEEQDTGQYRRPR